MTVRLSKENVENIKLLISQYLKKDTFTIQSIAQFVGKLVSLFPGVTHSKLFYRQLDIEKSNALKQNKGNFETPMQISHESRTDLKWFLDNLNHAFVDVSGKNTDFVLKTDASNSGWGGLLQEVDSNTVISHTRGQWTSEKTELHINLKELLAVYHSLLSLCPDKHVVIKICSDNSTAVSYIKIKGERF